MQYQAIMQQAAQKLYQEQKEAEEHNSLFSDYTCYNDTNVDVYSNNDFSNFNFFQTELVHWFVVDYLINCSLYENVFFVRQKVY